MAWKISLITISKAGLYSKEEWDNRLCLSHENGFQIRIRLLHCQISKSPRRGSLGDFRDVCLCMSEVKVLLKNIQFLPLLKEELDLFYLSSLKNSSSDKGLCLGLAQLHFWTKKNNAVFWKYCFWVHSWFPESHLKTTFPSAGVFWVWFCFVLNCNAPKETLPYIQPHHRQWS